MKGTIIKLFIILITFNLSISFVTACSVYGYTKDQNNRFINSKVSGICLATNELKMINIPADGAYGILFGSPFDMCRAYCKMLYLNASYGSLYGEKLINLSSYGDNTLAGTINITLKPEIKEKQLLDELNKFNSIKPDEKTSILPDKKRTNIIPLNNNSIGDSSKNLNKKMQDNSKNKTKQINNNPQTNINTIKQKNLKRSIFIILIILLSISTIFFLIKKRLVQNR